MTRMRDRSIYDLSWHERASCRSRWDLFFSVFNGRGDDNRRRVEQAKAICARCPVSADCLSYARSAKEEHGIWAGVDRDAFEKFPKGPTE